MTGGAVRRPAAIVTGLVVMSIWAAVSAGHAASGRVVLHNETASDQALLQASPGWRQVANTVGAGDAATARIEFPDRGVIVESLRYGDAGSVGCAVRVQTEIFNGRCTVVLSATPHGADRGRAAACRAALDRSSADTCDFQATIRFLP